MRSLLSILLAFSLGAATVGCGNVFVNGSFQASTVSGTVSVIQLTTVVSGSGTTVLVTFVTFLQIGTSTTMGFCGDQRSQFPMNQIVRASFTPGATCAAIIEIVIT